MNIESYLPSGCVTNGTVDYTSEVQKAINANEICVFPDFPIMVNDRGLIIPSDREITFNSQIIQKATSNGSYNAIRIQGANNVILHNPVITGERQKHLGTSGEWGHGIAIYGGSNITINGLNASYCWGDGLYIAGKDGLPPTNLTINDAVCTHNRRNGIAIASCNGLILNSPKCTNTYGVLPSCGIDIEPAGKTDEIKGLVINNPITDRSVEYGIAIGLSELLGGTNKVIDIKILNWSDSYSKAALRASVNLNRRAASEMISGTIDIINPFWKYNSVAPWQVDIRTPDIKLNLSTPSIRKTLTSAEMQPILTNKVNLNANHTITW